jgi:hypothetical protein
VHDYNYDFAKSKCYHTTDYDFAKSKCYHTTDYDFAESKPNSFSSDARRTAGEPGCD